MPETPRGRTYAASKAPKPKPKVSKAAAKRRATLTARAEARKAAKAPLPKPKAKAPTPPSVVTTTPTERYVPTAAEVEHYETVLKPELEAAVKKLPKGTVEKAAALGSEVASAEIERRAAATIMGAPEPPPTLPPEEEIIVPPPPIAERHVPTAEEVEHYETVVKPEMVEAVREMPTAAIKRAAMLGSEIAAAEVERREEAAPVIVPSAPEVPTPAELQHYEEVLKPELELAVKELPTEVLVRAAELGSKVAQEEFESRTAPGAVVETPWDEFNEKWTDKIKGDKFVGSRSEYRQFLEDFETAQGTSLVIYDYRGQPVEVTQSQYAVLFKMTGQDFVDTAVRMGIYEPDTTYEDGQIISGTAVRARQEAAAEKAKYADWTAAELVGGKVTPGGVYIPSPWGHKTGVYVPLPDWGKEKVYKAQLGAIEQLDSYKQIVETGKYVVRGTPKHPLGKRFPETVTSYDLPQAVTDEVPEATLKMAGFTDKDISDAEVIVKQQAEADALKVKYEVLERRLKPFAKWQLDPITYSMQESIDIGKALDEKAVTEAELVELGYTQENIDKAKVYHKEGWKVWIPVYGTVATWAVSTPLERGISVVGDALLLVPTVGWLGKAGSTSLQASTRALAVGIAPRAGILARTATAAKAGLYATEQITVAPITFPIQLIKSPAVALKGLWGVTKFPFVHPLETVKGIEAITTGKAFLGEPKLAQFAKLIAKPKAVPAAAVSIPTHGTGVQRVFASQGLTEAEALEATRLMQIRLSDMIALGRPIPRTIEVPVYEGGNLKLTIRYPTTRAMRELGIATTSTPFADRIMTGAAEPIARGKVYFSTAMSPEWTGVSARGLTTPEAVELGRGGAVIKTMRINRLFDPVSRTYRHSVELEMTVPTGTQMVTGRENVLEALKTHGNVKVYPSVVMEQTRPRDIIEALRASSDRQFTYKPLNFEEVQSFPKGSAKGVEQYVRTNDMMVGGSSAERTWTDTIKFPEDIDLVSIRNNAKVDARNLARIIESTSGFKARATKSTFRDKWDLEYYDPKVKWAETVVTTDPVTGVKTSSIHERIGKWVKVGDVLDYRVHMTYNPDVQNRQPVEVDGIKVEHPLEQAERIVAKYAEYVRGEIPLERHRGHPKRLAWMAEKVLDTPGGKLTQTQIKTLENIATRTDYTKITWDQLLRLKLGGAADSIRDAVSPRRVEIILPDGRRVVAPKGATEELRAFIKNRPGATAREIAEAARGVNERALYDRAAELLREGKARGVIEEVISRDPDLARIPKSDARRVIDALEAEYINDLRVAGRFTVNEIRGMIHSGLITSGTARAFYDLLSAPERLVLRDVIRPEEVRPLEEVVRPERVPSLEEALEIPKEPLKLEIVEPRVEEERVEERVEEERIEEVRVEEEVVSELEVPPEVRPPELEPVLEEAPRVPEKPLEVLALPREPVPEIVEARVELKRAEPERAAERVEEERGEDRVVEERVEERVAEERAVERVEEERLVRERVEEGRIRLEGGRVFGERYRLDDGRYRLGGGRYRLDNGRYRLIDEGYRLDEGRLPLFRGVGLGEVVEVKPGAIVWRQGALKGGDVWKVLEPPYTQLKPKTLVGEVPRGLRRFGKTPAETIQIIGAAESVPERVSIDLGVADIEVIEGREIRFAGKGLETDVGTRIPGPEKGMSVPASPLRFGTSFEEALEYVPRSEAQREFIEKQIRQMISEMSVEDFVERVERAKLPQERIKELLEHMPDREREVAQALLAGKEQYVSVGRVQYARLRPTTVEGDIATFVLSPELSEQKASHRAEKGITTKKEVHQRKRKALEKAKQVVSLRDIL